MAMSTFEAILAALVVAAVEKVGKRRFENCRYFERVECQLESRLDPANHRRDAETRRYFVLRKAPEQANVGARQPDFLFSFA